ncbi:hypothetical protein CEXT_289841 [Caerostris extrusa]|uniref:Uncharacterized protein n=1 Tax=Caerostris extrusa TaxID=172846 RepID=A0AAV4NBI9_CAEEX|nr:hypothetical protein CEXT_289841 [Caerostris extrusa]
MNHFPLLFLGTTNVPSRISSHSGFPKVAFRSRNSKICKSPVIAILFSGKKEKGRGENGALLNYSLPRGVELKMAPALHRMRFTRTPKQKKEITALPC